jgi:hypothetical protein
MTERRKPCGLLQGIWAERCAEIEAISLDMWPAFIGACEENAR